MLDINCISIHTCNGCMPLNHAWPRCRCENLKNLIFSRLYSMYVSGATLRMPALIKTCAHNMHTPRSRVSCPAYAFLTPLLGGLRRNRPFWPLIAVHLSM